MLAQKRYVKKYKKREKTGKHKRPIFPELDIESKIDSEKSK
jgi:hypothetical protein